MSRGIEALARRHGGFLEALARSRLKRSPLGEDEAEDLVQEVWASLLALAREGPPPGRPYLAAMVLNGVRMRLRARSRFPGDLQPAPPAQPLEVLLKTEDAERLQEALGALEPRERLALRWVHAEGLSYAEAARLLGIGEGGLGALLSRARKKMRQALQEV